MKKNLSVLLALLMLFSLAGCGIKEDLTAARNDLAAAQYEISALQTEIDALNEKADTLTAEKDALNSEVEEVHAGNLVLSERITQLQAKPEYVDLMGTKYGSLLQKEPEHRLWLMQEGSQMYLSYNADPYCPAVAGEIVEAYLALSLYDEEGNPEETWLLVKCAVYSIPAPPIYWVRASECVPYTDANRTDARSPVRLREGAMVTTEFGTAEASEHELDNIYAIGSIDNGTAHISAAGGWSASVSAEDILYPDPDTFTFMD